MADGECGWRGWRVSRQWWSSLWWPLCTHLPQPQPQPQSASLLSFSLVFCVYLCFFFLCLLLLLRYIFLSAHLLRTINENAHINISYFNTKTTHKMTTSRASRGSILLCRAPPSAPPTSALPIYSDSRILLFSSEYFRPLNWHTRIRHRIHFLLSLILCFFLRFLWLSVCVCVCLHKFCNISGLCLQLANALKTQIYIFFCSVLFVSCCWII